MSLTATLQAATPLLGGLFELVDHLYTTDEEREAAKLRVLELHHSGALAQMEVNKVEAGHSNIFVSGWRPFVGWTCGLAFAWTFVVFPIFTAVVSYIAMVNNVIVDFAGVPQADMETMMPVMMGMLGLGALRSWEKINKTKGS